MRNSENLEPRSLRTPTRTLLAMFALLVASAAGSQELSDLRGDFELEARMLDADIQDYTVARGRERNAIERLQRVNRRLDVTVADPNASPAELIRLESEVATAREAAYTRSREAAEARGRMYNRMQRLAQLVREVERQGVEVVGRSQLIGGMWRLEAGPEGLIGLLSLKQDGSLVIGSYRLSNGRRGSAKGTFAGDRLELQMVDSERGLVGTVEGELDPDSGEIQGTWQAMELAAGRPSAGRWTARRVSAEEDLGLDR